MKTRKISDEVLYPDEEIVRIDADFIEALEKMADANARERARLCAHRSEKDAVHEMIIVHKAGTYVRPHKHLDKSESFHFIKGRADVVIFDDAGEIQQIVPMGELGSGLCVYYRLDSPLYHSLLIRSEYAVFHEVTRGPFNRAETVFPDWAPEDGEVPACRDFINKLVARLKDR